MDLDKLKTVPSDLGKLSNVVDNDVVKRLFDKLVTKVNTIDTKLPSTRGLVSKPQYDSDKQGLEKEIEDVNRKILNNSELIKKTH